jgi:tether containing UBX domain for GLUT4
VALQIPATESNTPQGIRLVDKFSSASSLWQVLRAFESGKAGKSDKVWNFTAKGFPSSQSGAGRLNHSFPTLNIMGRDYASFLDLQKTLAQLGFNDGSVLLRLNFRETDTALHDALSEIEQYFKSIEENIPAGAHANTNEQNQSLPAQQQPSELDDPKSPELVSDITESGSPNPTVGDDTSASNDTLANDSSTVEPAPVAAPIPGVTPRPITVFSPPSSTTPQAALEPHNESDYVPNIDLMKKHQASIVAETRNKRLLTDAELAEQEAAKNQKLALVQEISIKIVFPDQSSVLAPFTTEDTTETLYSHVRHLLARNHEPFSLSYNAEKGMKPLKEGKERLIADLKFTGRILVRVLWGEGASLDARKEPSLRSEVAQQARELGVQQTKSLDVKDESPAQVPENKEKGKRKEGGVPKWLKLPGKK